MAAAVRSAELSAPIGVLERLDGYAHCHIVFRWRGRVVGRATAPVPASGCLTSEVVQALASKALDAGALRVWLEDVLAFDERVRPSVRPRVTVAICTRDRTDDVARALRAAADLMPPPDEVLVVDNAPRTDATRLLVASHPGVRYVCEPRAGLDAARNRALRDATGDVVAFVDDDAVPEPGWVDALCANFGDPRVQCVTGLTLPLELETPAQELFEAYSPFARGFARRVFDGRLDNPVAVARVGAGANMAVRRSVRDTVGGFDERLDAGTPTRSGGDHDFFVRLLLDGWRIVYEPAAVCWHRHRRTDAEVVETIRGYGTGVWAMWIGLLIHRREFSVLRLAWAWFRTDHLPVLLRPRRLLARRGADRLRRAELLGCLRAPLAWWASRRRSAA